MDCFNTSVIDSSWKPIVLSALDALPHEYLSFLRTETSYLPGPQKILRAFSQPLQTVTTILWGESPYPRPESANGYAFWDDNVGNIWSPSGLSKTLNRATSLRNFIKMLLMADGALQKTDLSQAAIASLDKSNYINSIPELFAKLLNQGVLLLNATLTLTSRGAQKDAKAWLPFVEKLLVQVFHHQPSVQLLLFGRVAKIIGNLPIARNFKQLKAEHPYNLSFISNDDVLEWFKPWRLLNQ